MSATATDANGNVYIAGSFIGTITLGSVTLTSSSGYYLGYLSYPPDGFVAKWVPASGTFAWVKRMTNDAFYPTGYFDYRLRIERLVVSGTSVYLCGSHTDRFKMDGTPYLGLALGRGTTDGFVAKLTDAGTSASWVWAAENGGIGQDAALGLAVEGANVYVSGYFQTPGVFGNVLVNNVGADDAFVYKLIDQGSTYSRGWVYSLGSLGYDRVSQVLASGNTLYLTGYFYNSMSLGSSTLVSAGGFDGFVAKLTDAGSTASLGWAQAMGGTGTDMVTDAALSGNSLYLAGSFATTMQLGGTTLTSAGGTDGFVAKLTDMGSTSSFAWAYGLGGPQTDAAQCIVTQGSKVYVAGQFGGGAPAPGAATFGSTTLQSAGSDDLFVTRLLDAGSTSSITWAQQAGSTNSEAPRSLALSGASIYVAGGFASPSLPLGTQTLINPQATGNASDGFLTSLSDLTLLSNFTLPPSQAGQLLYPNPASTAVTVPVPDAPGQLTATLTLYDVRGRLVRTARPTPGTSYVLDLTGLASGLYLVKVQAGDALTTQRLLVH